MTTRVGVIADTHCPEFVDRIPARVFEVFNGVALILHAGDIDGEETLAALRRLAPVEAVRGELFSAEMRWGVRRKPGTLFIVRAAAVVRRHDASLA